MGEKEFHINDFRMVIRLAFEKWIGTIFIIGESALAFGLNLFSRSTGLTPLRKD